MHAYTIPLTTASQSQIALLGLRIALTTASQSRVQNCSHTSFSDSFRRSSAVRPGSQPLDRNVQWFRGGLVFEALRLMHQHKAQGTFRTCNESKEEEVTPKLTGLPRTQDVDLTPRKVDARLPGKRNSNSHGARPVHLIIIKWIRTSRLSRTNSLPDSLTPKLTDLQRTQDVD